jgi:hypothetical protein
MPDEIDWTVATWEGNRRRQHEEFRALTLRDKLSIIEQMGEVAAVFSHRAETERRAGDDRVEPEPEA